MYRKSLRSMFFCYKQNGFIKLNSTEFYLFLNSFIKKVSRNKYLNQYMNKKRIFSSMSEVDIMHDLFLFMNKHFKIETRQIDSFNQFKFIFESTLINFIKRKYKTKKLIELPNNFCIDESLNYTNVAFYNWFYSNLKYKNLYTDVYSQLPVNKDTYVKYIKELRNEWNNTRDD